MHLRKSQSSSDNQNSNDNSRDNYNNNVGIKRRRRRHRSSILSNRFATIFIVVSCFVGVLVFIYVPYNFNYDHKHEYDNKDNSNPNGSSKEQGLVSDTAMNESGMNGSNSDVNGRKRSRNVCKNAQTLKLSEEVYHAWSRIDDLVADVTKARNGKRVKVSGGVFLYPRQSALLVELIRLYSQPEDMRLGNRPGFGVRGSDEKEQGKTIDWFRVCETGFGSGHSSALFLSAGKHVKVVTFDKFDRPYQKQSVQILNKLFSVDGEDRLEYRAGDSCKELTKYVEEGGQCDFLHGSSMCPNDNIKLVEATRGETILTSTAMSWDTYRDRLVYFSEDNKGQWSILRKSHCIKNIACYEEKEATLNKNLVLGEKGKVISHKFCFAVTTGKCSRLKATSKGGYWKIPTSVKDFKELCPSAVIEVPPVGKS